jgi:hypothetical protein
MRSRIHVLSNNACSIQKVTAGFCLIAKVPIFMGRGYSEAQPRARPGTKVSLTFTAIGFTNTFVTPL